MRYQVLMLDVPNDYYNALKYRFSGVDVSFTIALTLQDVSHLCVKQHFHLVILKYHDFTLCSKFCIALRRISFAPFIILVDQYDAENACDVLQSGADLCIGTAEPINLSVDHIMAQFRRYTTYNQHKESRSSFQEGDIYIDPQRNVVRVKERSVRLRRREFLLLLYFMKNPKHVLSAEQICKHAWKNEGCYVSGVSGPIAILRKAIEPDPAHPIYITTVKSFGYCFTAYKSETCDICSDSVGFL